MSSITRWRCHRNDNRHAGASNEYPCRTERGLPWKVFYSWKLRLLWTSGDQDRQYNLEKSDHRVCKAAGFFDGQNLRFRNFHVGTSFWSDQQGFVTILQKCPSDAQLDSPEAQLHDYRSPDPSLKCAHRPPMHVCSRYGKASPLTKAINTVRCDRYCALKLAEFLICDFSQWLLSAVTNILKQA